MFGSLTHNDDDDIAPPTVASPKDRNPSLQSTHDINHITPSDQLLPSVLMDERPEPPPPSDVGGDFPSSEATSVKRTPDRSYETPDRLQPNEFMCRLPMELKEIEEMVFDKETNWIIYLLVEPLSTDFWGETAREVLSRMPHPPQRRFSLIGSPKPGPEPESFIFRIYEVLSYQTFGFDDSGELIQLLKIGEKLNPIRPFDLVLPLNDNVRRMISACQPAEDEYPVLNKRLFPPKKTPETAE